MRQPSWRSRSIRERLALAGDPVPVAEQIQLIGVGLLGVFSASANGLLVYQTGTGAIGSRLAWYDRTGKQVASVGDVASYGDLELASDGKHASVSLQVTGSRDIWLYDLERELRTRFTFDSAAELGSIWSPDGSRVVFNSTRKGVYDLYQKPCHRSGADEILFEDKTNKYPVSWSPDGRSILFRAVGGSNRERFVRPAAHRRQETNPLHEHAVQRNLWAVLARRPVDSLQLE